MATFCKLFLCTVVDQGVHQFLFISDEHILKQSKIYLLFINSLFIIYYDFLKIFNIVGNLKKKCGHREKSCELKQLLSLRVYLSEKFKKKGKKKENKEIKLSKFSFSEWL